jgi:ABC-type hemin transport system substrate-binding protein
MTVLLKRVALAMPETILIMTPGSDGNAGLSFGKETYLDDLLQMMGGTNALNDSGWVSLSLEDIARLNPDAILVVSDTPFEPSAALTSLDIPIKTFIHEDVLIPSSRIVDVAQAMQQELSAQ